MLYYKLPLKVDLDTLTHEVFNESKLWETYRRKGNGVGENGKITNGKGSHLTPTPFYKVTGDVFTNKNDRNRFESLKLFIGVFLTKLSNIDYIKDDLVQISCWNLKYYHRDYKAIYTSLINRGIVVCDYSYCSVGYQGSPYGYCKGFGLTKKYQNNYKRIPAHAESFMRVMNRLANMKYHSDSSTKTEDVLLYQYNLFKYKCEVIDPDWSTIDMDVSTAEHIQRGLTKFKQQVFNVKSSSIVNRVSNTVSQMPKEGRQFIRYKETGEEFVSCDISASHFTFLCFLMEFDKERLIEMVSKDFYSQLANGQCDRQVIKSQSFKYLYGRNRKNSSIGKCMNRELPKLHQYILGMNKEQKTELSHVLMKVESDIVVRDIGGQLMKLNIPFYTVHDSVWTLSRYVDQVKTIMEDTIQNILQVDVKPHIKVD